MAFSQLYFFSKSLGMQTQVNVIIPQRDTQGEIGTNNKAENDKYKCLYLLHGLSDDHTIWMRRTSIERYASEYGICVVMPCADKSYYCNMKYGMKYYDYIAKELPAVIQELFPVSDKREDNYVAGLSMGGYGALKIGLRESDRFCAAAGFSSAVDIKNMQWEDIKKSIFGEDMKVLSDDDLFELAEKHKNDKNKPRLFMGIGMEDGFYESNLRFRDKLKSLGYDITYKESHGTHCWEFWDEYIQYALDWMFNP